MSWTDYTTFLKKDGIVEHCALFNRDDGVPLAADGVALSEHEVDLLGDDGVTTTKTKVNETKLLLELFNNQGVIKSWKGGLWVGKTKYQVVMFDKDTDTAYLKKEGGGACAVRTNKVIVFGTWNQSINFSKDGKTVPQNPGDLNKAVEALAKMLKDAGY